MRPFALHDTGYSGRIYVSDGIREHAGFVLRTLEKLRGQFDFVAVTGKSGMAVAFAALAMGADFNLVTVRKGESTHGAQIEGIADGPRYVVIDDLIDTGATLDRIHAKLTELADTYNREHPRMVAAIMYGTGGLSRNRNEWHVEGQEAPIVVYGAGGGSGE